MSTTTPEIKSDLQAQHARTDKAQADIPVTGTPGLSLRVSREGRKSWTLRYRRQSDNKLRRQTLGNYPDLKLADARERARLARSEVTAGKDPASVKSDRRAAGTFAEIAANWLRRHAEKKKCPAAVYDDTMMLNRDVLPFIGDTKAAEVTRRDIEKILDTMADRGVKVRSNRVLTLLRTIFRWAVKRGDVLTDPTTGIDKPEIETPRDRVLSHDELRTLWANLTTAPMTVAVRLIIKLCAVTGQRVGEVAGIAMSELSADWASPAPLWTIPATRCKNGKEHRVPLSDLAVTLIAEAQRIAGPSAWLFPSPTGDGPIDGHAATRAVSRMRGKKVLGVDGFRIHDLRRTAATGMGDLAFDDFVIGLVLNHSPIGVTRAVYNRSGYDEPKRRALEAWGIRLEEILGMREPVTNVVALPQTKRGT